MSVLGGPGGFGPPPSAERGRTIRIGVAVVVTVFGLLALVWVGGEGGRDDDVETSGTVAGETTTSEPGAVAPPSSVYEADLDPGWAPKEASVFAESEEAKQRRDDRPDPVASTTTEPDEATAAGR